MKHLRLESDSLQRDVLRSAQQICRFGHLIRSLLERLLARIDSSSP